MTSAPSVPYVLCVLLLAGCSTPDIDWPWEPDGGTNSTTTAATTTTTAVAEPEPSDDIPAGTQWLHTDVSAWPVTATLIASVSGRPGGKVTLNYDKARTWPDKGGLNANPWVFAQVDGQWYAATWEWLRTGQTLKDMQGKSWGGHIKRPPLNTWEPSPGVRIGLMVSGLCRDAKRNAQERTNIVWLTWPLAQAAQPLSAELEGALE